jgi:GAF domain-containing protein
MADLDDPNRLAALDHVVTARAPDSQLDALINGVAAVAGAPIALVSIVCESVQYFRAQTGLAGELATERTTAREDSFCQFVVKNEKPFIVTDAATDTRVPQALVEQYGVRSYVGVPLHYNGQLVGSVCAIDTVPRDFSELQVEAIRGLSRYISQRLEALRTDAEK